MNAYLCTKDSAVLCAEEPCKIVTPLQDLTVQESDSVTLILELSKPRAVKWLKQGEPVDERFRVAVDDTGLRHTLTIDNVLLEDSQEFSVDIDDLRYGVIHVSCHLNVTGRGSSGTELGLLKESRMGLGYPCFSFFTAVLIVRLTKRCYHVHDLCFYREACGDNCSAARSRSL